VHADRPRTGPCVVLVNESLVRGQVVSVVVVRTVRTTRFTNLRVGGRRGDAGGVRLDEGGVGGDSGEGRMQ
jgi:hypothetical protein